MEEKQLNLFQKLAVLREQVEVIQRNKQGYGYNYVSEDAIMAKISVGMKQYGLLLVPNIVAGTTKTEARRWDKSKWTKDGKPFEEHIMEHVVTADMTYTWINTENPEERFEVGWSMVGQQPDASQAFGSGLSYATRYFLLKFFTVATPDDDPETFRKRQKETEEEQAKRVAEAIVEQLDAIVKKTISGGVPADSIKQFMIENGVRNGNYFQIKDADTAGRLLTAFQEKFMNNGGNK